MHAHRTACRIFALAWLGMTAGCAASRPHVAVQVDSDTRAPAFSLLFAAPDEQAHGSLWAAKRPAQPVQLASANVAAELPRNPTLTVLDGPSDLEAADAFPSTEEGFSVHDDLHDLGPSLGHDLRALANWETAGILAAGGAASLAVRKTVDDDVSDWTLESPNRWGSASEVLAALGNPAHHFAAAGLLWGTSLATQDPYLHDASGAMIDALILTNASTLLLKVAANSDAPNGESLGWPSGHTASSFTMAAVLDEYYGPWAGLAAYGLAGLVSFSRIDDREHDLSDVIFGAALGYSIGKVVAARHHCDSSGITLLPYLEPVEGTTGVALEGRF